MTVLTFCVDFSCFHVLASVAANPIACLALCVSMLGPLSATFKRIASHSLIGALCTFVHLTLPGFRVR